MVDQLLLEESKTVNAKEMQEVVVSKSHTGEKWGKSSRTAPLMGYGIYCVQFWAPQ